MTDGTILTGQLIGTIGAIVAFVSLAVVFYRAGKGPVWIAAVVLVPLLLSTVGTIYSAQLVAEGQLPVERYFLVLRFKEWLLPFFLLVLAVSPWPRLAKQN